MNETEQFSNSGTHPTGEFGNLHEELTARDLVIEQTGRFLERVTHWQEGKPDLHDMKMLCKQPSAEALAARDRKRDAALLRKLSETFRKKENWGIDPVHYLLRLASECESGEWKPDLEVK